MGSPSRTVSTFVLTLSVAACGSGSSDGSTNDPAGGAAATGGTSSQGGASAQGGSSSATGGSTTSAGGSTSASCTGITGTYSIQRTIDATDPGSCQSTTPGPIKVTIAEDQSGAFDVSFDAMVSTAKCVANKQGCSLFASCNFMSVDYTTTYEDDIKWTFSNASFTGTEDFHTTKAGTTCTVNLDEIGSRE
jgi:hypothetical protein